MYRVNHEQDVVVVGKGHQSSRSCKLKQVLIKCYCTLIKRNNASRNSAILLIDEAIKVSVSIYTKKKNESAKAYCHPIFSFFSNSDDGNNIQAIQSKLIFRRGKPAFIISNVKRKGMEQKYDGFIVFYFTRIVFCNSNPKDLV